MNNSLIPLTPIIVAILIPVSIILLFTLNHFWHKIKLALIKLGNYIHLINPVTHLETIVAFSSFFLPFIIYLKIHFPFDASFNTPLDSMALTSNELMNQVIFKSLALSTFCMIVFTTLFTTFIEYSRSYTLFNNIMPNHHNSPREQLNQKFSPLKMKIAAFAERIYFSDTNFPFPFYFTAIFLGFVLLLITFNALTDILHSTLATFISFFIPFIISFICLLSLFLIIYGFAKWGKNTILDFHVLQNFVKQVEQSIQLINPQLNPPNLTIAQTPEQINIERVLAEAPGGIISVPSWRHNTINRLMRTNREAREAIQNNRPIIVAQQGSTAANPASISYIMGIDYGTRSATANPNPNVTTTAAAGANQGINTIIGSWTSSAGGDIYVQDTLTVPQSPLATQLEMATQTNEKLKQEKKALEEEIAKLKKENVEEYNKAKEKARKSINPILNLDLEK